MPNEMTPRLLTENVGEVNLLREYAVRLRKEAAKHGISFIDALNQGVGLWAELSEAGVLLASEEVEVVAYKDGKRFPIKLGPVIPRH